MPEEILATLDADGTLGALPFMPEMADLCGQRLRVSRRVGRMCMSGPQVWGTMREFDASDVVFLDDVRCSGAAHGGCQRACAIFWREAWLRKVTPGSTPLRVSADARERLRRRLKTEAAPKTYFCQASELFKLTNVLTRREQLQRCVDEVHAGETGAVEMARRISTWLFWKVRKRVIGEHARSAQRKTPTVSLGLQPGDWVQVKPLEQIAKTLDVRGYNRGLYFSPDMRRACGKRFRVKSRIDRIIDDGTGQMRELSNTVALEGSLCGCPYINVGGCSRADIVYWREIWLERVASPVPERAPAAGQLLRSGASAFS